MLTREATMSNGKKIYVFDNVYDYTDRADFKVFAQESLFKATGGSDRLDEHRGRLLLSQFSDDDLNRFGVFLNKNNRLDKIFELIGSRQPTRNWLLLSDLSTKMYFHADEPSRENSLISQDGFTFLFYVNIEWKDDWGGETLFGTDQCEAELAVSYKPGRVVVFDSTITHKAAPISADAPFRYTFNSTFEFPKGINVNLSES
jgi:hypothetical protein